MGGEFSDLKELGFFQEYFDGLDVGFAGCGCKNLHGFLVHLPSNQYLQTAAFT